MDADLKSDLMRRYNRCLAATSDAMGSRAASILCIKTVFDSRGIKVRLTGKQQADKH